MIWYILFIVGCFLLIIGIHSEFHKMKAIYGIIIMGFAFLSGICLTANDDSLAFDYSENEVLTETTDIYNLADRYSVRGNFYLGTGDVSESEYYYFLRQTDKGKIIDKIPQNITYITEDNTQKPRIEEYSYEGKSNKSVKYWFTLTLDINEDETSYKTAYYRVYLPEKSIKTDFSVDLN